MLHEYRHDGYRLRSPLPSRERKRALARLQRSLTDNEPSIGNAACGSSRRVARGILMHVAFRRQLRTLTPAQWRGTVLPDPLYCLSPSRVDAKGVD